MENEKEERWRWWREGHGKDGVGERAKMKKMEWKQESGVGKLEKEVEILEEKKGGWRRRDENGRREGEWMETEG